MVDIIHGYASEISPKVFFLLESIALTDIENAKKLALEVDNLNLGEFGFLNLITRNAIEREYARGDFIDLFLYFIEHGADINFEADGNTPLMIIIDGIVEYYHASLGFVEFALQNKADPNYYNQKSDSTILMVACKTNSTHVVGLLLKYGANINGRNKEGQTALMISAKKKNLIRVLKFLIDNGADLKIKDNYGRTAFMHAVYNLQQESADMLSENSIEKQIVFPYNCV